jgi:hypothetical protein
MNRKRIYIAGPITKGPLEQNINQATAAFVELTRLGMAPFCPHWSCYSGTAIKVPDGRVVAYAGANPNKLTNPVNIRYAPNKLLFARSSGKRLFEYKYMFISDDIIITGILACK